MKNAKEKTKTETIKKYKKCYWTWQKLSTFYAVSKKDLENIYEMQRFKPLLMVLKHTRKSASNKKTLIHK